MAGAGNGGQSFEIEFGVLPMQDFRSFVFGLLLAATPLAGSAQTSSPPTIDGRRCRLVDYCKVVGLPPADCASNVFFAVKDNCNAADQVQAVSCSIDNFDFGPTLVENGISEDGKTGICVYKFDGGTPVSNRLPTAKITMRCSNRKTEPTPPCPTP